MLKIKVCFLLILSGIVTAPVFAAVTSLSNHPNTLSDITRPLTGVDPAHADESDLAALDAVVGEATIVGLGEDTHGTREFFQMKHRLLQYLVRQKGFSVFAIEAAMPYADRVNNYVLTGTGDPKKLAGMGFWTWNTEEVLAMIEWVRSYNKTAAQKILFTGFDMQAQPATYLEAITEPLLRANKGKESHDMAQIVSDLSQIDDVRKALEPVDENYNKEARSLQAKYSQLLADLRARHLPVDEFEQQKEQLNEEAIAADTALDEKYSVLKQPVQVKLTALARTLTSRVNQVIDSVIQDRDNVVIHLGQQTYERVLEYSRLINEYIYLESRLAGAERFQARDRSMADNIFWIQKQNPGAKLVLWAHNGHIYHPAEHPVMGALLRVALGAQYRAIGFVTYEGRYRAVGHDFPPYKLGVYDLQTPPENALEAAINQLNMPIALLDFTHAEQLPDFLLQPVLMRCGDGIGSMEIVKEEQFEPAFGSDRNSYLGVATRNYEGLIFVKTTSASVMLQG